MLAVNRQLAAPSFFLSLNLQCAQDGMVMKSPPCPLHRTASITHVSAASSHSMPVAYSGLVWEGSMGSDLCLVILSFPTE